MLLGFLPNSVSVMFYPSRSIYGIRAWPMFDFMRDVAMPQHLTCVPLLSWGIEIAAAIVNSLAPQFSETSMVARRVKNYWLLRNMLKRQDDTEFTTLLICILSAAWLEKAKGDEINACMHVKATLDLLRPHGGLRALQRRSVGPSVNISMVFEMLGVPMIFTTRRTIDNACEKVKPALQAFQDWTRLIWQERRRRSHQDGSSSGENHSLPHHAHSLDYESYWAMRQSTLGPASTPGRLLAVGIDQARESHWRPVLITLYTLNDILYNLGDELGVAEQFLSDLGSVSENSIDPNLDLDDLPPFVFSNFCFWMARSADNHGLWFDHGESSPPAMRTWEALEFAELMMLAPPETRKRVMNALFLWLYCEPEEELDDKAILEEADLDDIKEEIVNAWEAANRV